MGLPQNKRQPLYTEIDRRFRRSGIGGCIHLTVDVSEPETDRDANFGIFGVQMECRGAFQRITDVAPFLMEVYVFDRYNHPDGPMIVGVRNDGSVVTNVPELQEEVADWKLF